MCSSRSRNCRGIELSSRDFKTVAISVTRAKPKNCRAYRAYRAGTWKLSRYRTIEQGLENCRAYRAGTWKLSSISSISSRDLKTVEVSNYRAGTSKLSQYRSLEQSYTVLTHGMLEQIEKLSRYRTIKQGLQNCRNIGHSRPKNCRAYQAYRAGTWKLSRYRTIEQGLENCRAYRAYRAGTWKLSSISSISSRDLKTVEVSNYRAGTWKLSQYRSLEHCPMWWGKSSYAITTSVRVVGAWPKNCQADRETVEVSNYRAGTSKLSQYRSLELSYTVLTHGLHVWALALRHSPLQAT